MQSDPVTRVGSFEIYSLDGRNLKECGLSTSVVVELWSSFPVQFFKSRELVKKRRVEKASLLAELDARLDEDYYKQHPELRPAPSQPGLMERLDRWLRKRRDLAYLNHVIVADLSQDKIVRDVTKRPDIHCQRDDCY